ncbi:hypothetical protein [Reichenbachiella ulvae]|uniref:Uncharacterized protein n=1 Tax=Reichenbachiella ulvae TaxID=2980104 RepID=A0ABT3CRL7_9BACT|nr:hypothetical protein [Reichenbachiella ulvae]MCV9386267.1 hypothetical protein [Reichenbachiella ulvae]
MFKNILSISLILLSVSFSSLGYGMGGKNKKEEKATQENKQEVYQVRQHVMVTLKSGQEVEAVVYGHISKNKYWVRQIGSSRQGKVKVKYMRPVSEK